MGGVLGFDPLVEDWPAGVAQRTLRDLLAESDIVSLHLPLTSDSWHLLDDDALRQMRPGGLVVNVSRGGLIDEEALLAALDQGRIAGAALDVLTHEPPEGDTALVSHPRTLVTPHAAYHSEHSKHEYVTRQAENVLAWHRTGAPVSPVTA